MKVKPTLNPGKVTIEIGIGEEGLLVPLGNRTEASPFRVKRILVPLDFSSCSLKALAYAIPFAKEYSAVLDLLHVVPPYYAVDPYGVAGYEAIEQQLIATAGQKLSNLVLDRVPQEVQTETYVRNGRPSQEIVHAAKEMRADLIIISTHGRTGLQHAFIGSTAENVVQQAPCPVLTVREKEHEFITQ